MLRKVIRQYMPIELIAGIFPKGKTSLVYGESGVGKTVSTIKAINSEDLVPILLDYDDNLSPQENGCEYIHIDGTRVHDDDEIVSDEIVIVDTWAMCNKDLIELLQNNNNTVIIIGHSLGLATRRDLPDAPDEFVNHLAAKLFLSYEKPKGKNTEGHYNLEIMKCRGYKGPRIIQDWMRNEDHEALDRMLKDSKL